MSKIFRYQTIERELRTRIERGELSEGQRMETTQELAQEFGASVITVNKALQNLVDSGYITRTPRKGSIVNAHDRWNRQRLSGTPTGMIGAIVFDSSSPFLWAKGIRGMETALSDRGYHLVIGNDNGDLGRAKQYIDDLAQKGIEGFLLVPIGRATRQEYERDNLALVRTIDDYGIPYVFFHRYLDGVSESAVVLDNYLDTVRLMESFLQTGVSNPLCLSHYYDSVVEERERGFIDALRAAGFVDAHDRIRRLHPEGQTVTQTNYDEIAQVLAADPTIDAVFTISADLLSAALEVQAQQEGSENRPLSFASFDYSETLFAHPSVRMVMEPAAYDMGVLAAESIVEKVRGARKFPVRSSLPSRLLIKPPTD